MIPSRHFYSLGQSRYPEIIFVLFILSVAQLTDIYRALLTPLSVNSHLLQDVFYWYVVKYKNFESRTRPENFRTSSRFAGGKVIAVDFQDFEECYTPCCCSLISLPVQLDDFITGLDSIQNLCRHEGLLDKVALIIQTKPHLANGHFHVMEQLVLECLFFL